MGLWFGKQKNSDIQSTQPSPESTSTSETPTPQPSKPFMDKCINQNNGSSEEGETSEDSIDNIV